MARKMGRMASRIGPWLSRIGPRRSGAPRDGPGRPSPARDLKVQAAEKPASIDDERLAAIVGDADE